MRFFLYFGSLCLSLPFVFRWPFFGLCVYSVVSFLQPKMLCWRPDLADSMIVGPPLVLGALLFGAERWQLYPVRDRGTGRIERIRGALVRNAPFEWSGLLLMMVALIAYIGLTRVVSEYSLEPTSEAYRRVCKVVLITVLMTGLVPDRRRLLILYVLIALAVGFWAVKGGLWVLLKGPHQVYGEDYDNNLFALKSVMVVPMAYYFALWLRPAWPRKLLLGACALMVLSVIGSGSRSGFLALGFVMFCIAATGRHRVKQLSALGLVTVVAVALSWSEIRTRFDSIYHYERDRSALSRFYAWRAMLDRFASSPILGVGFGNSERPYDANRAWSRAGHNIWLQNLAELGLVGHALWLAMVLGTMWRLHRTMRFAQHAAPEMRVYYFLCRGLLLGLCGYWVHGMFHNDEYLDLMFTFVGFTVVIEAVRRREGQEMKVRAAVAESGEIAVSESTAPIATGGTGLIKAPGTVRCRPTAPQDPVLFVTLATGRSA